LAIFVPGDTLGRGTIGREKALADIDRPEHQFISGQDFPA
jgi:hypothetical protein